MFHPEKIQRKIETIEKTRKIKLREYSVQESISMYEYLKSMERPDGKRIVYAREGQAPQQFQYTTQEAAWIQNEMLMCACSFPYFYYRYFFIKTKDGNIQRPDKLIAQLIFLAILAELDIRNLPILLLILKARQLGISTIMEAIILWIALFVPGSHCVLASAEEEKSEQMSNMVWLGLEMLPLFMKPVLTRDNKQVGPEFGLIHTDILIQHGSMTKGISRGDTPIAAHLSEVAYYPNPIETIESSLIRAMHENPRTLLALESTARKKDDWFHRTWLKNRKGEETGYNRFTCIFLPWYVGNDKYPTKDFLLSHPIPANWKPMKETLKQAADAKLYVSTTPLLRKHMPGNWEMPREQMWYWEFNYTEALEGGDETHKAFLAELASDERSAFQSKKWSVFSQSVLDALESNRSDKYTDYAMVGDGLDSRFALPDFQSHSGKRVDIQWQTIDGKILSWKLIPLRETPRDDKLDFYLRIFEKPKAGYKYTIGIDIASGQGLNRTVFFVNRVGKEGEPDVEVALLCSAWIASPETPAFANLLGIYYGQYMSPVAEAKLAPEVQKAVGDFISFQLAKLGYSNFYYMERFDLRKQPGHKPTRRGWASVSWSMQMMKEAFEHAIKAGWIKVNSEQLIQELEWLESDETDSGKTVYDHAKDKTDDVYVGGGIAYFTSHDQETIMERMKGNLKPLKKADEEEEKPLKLRGLDLLSHQFRLEDAREHPDQDDEYDRYSHIF